MKLRTDYPYELNDKMECLRSGPSTERGECNVALRETESKRLWDRVSEQNLLRQYDLLMNCIEIGLDKGIDAFDKYTLYTLNHIAVANLSQQGGRFRKEPVRVGSHIPPHFKDVPVHMDIFLSVVHENWDIVDGPTDLAAFALWKLNWIHPFVEGNGRTARAACYYLLCLRYGGFIPGDTIVPERIRANRTPYYDALKAADTSYHDIGQYDVSDLSSYLKNLMQAQISET